MKAIFLSVPTSLVLAWSLQAFTYEPPPVVVGSVIPDGSFSGLVSSVEYSTIACNRIVEVEVDLTIAGGYNGDLYAYLWHETPDLRTAIAVLLNRVGKTGADAFGYADGGFAVTFADGAPKDVHQYGGNAGNPLTGIWQPDGRTASPLTVTESSPRSAFLDAFTGMDPNGKWVLAVYDLGSGEESTLVQWSLRMELVPEPEALGSVSVIGLALFLWGRRLTGRA